MKQKSSLIATEIDRMRGELQGNLDELQTIFKDAVDWRKSFQKRPLTVIALAFGGGLAVSSRIGGLSRRR